MDDEDLRAFEPDPDDLESLAATEHESWSRWTTWMLSEIEREASAYAPARRDDFLELLGQLSCVQRWRRQLVTPYADLSEKEKESDREVARGKLKVYRG